jgi:hypothetical protein
MRLCTMLAGWVHGALLFAVVPAAKAADPPPEVVTDPWTTEARRHFKSGVKLYQEANFAAALAEFEAAYQKKPGPGSLQNVALCQKALLRYAEAADTLKLLLERHGGELSEEEKTAARLAYEELEAHVGSIVIRVRPAHAKVTLDGRSLDAASLGTPLRTSQGDHTLVVQAPGYERTSRAVRVASGAVPLSVDVALTPVMGFLDVRASDPSAVIAIDGRPVGLGTWSGPVTPGEDHLVQVYRTGYEPFETRVSVDVGETKPIAGTLGERVEAAATHSDAGTLPPPPAARPKLGWYSIAGLSFIGTNTAPLGLDVDGETANTGASLSLRVGRRVWAAFGMEALLETGSINVERACADFCGSDDRVNRNFQLGWFRFGPAARITTPGEKWRFGAGFGTGLVWHQLKVARHEGLDADGGKAAGFDPFFLFEVGANYHFGHLSIGVELSAAVDGAGSLDGTFDGRNQRPFEGSGNAIPMLGIGVRAGYHQFPPEKKRR